MRQAGILAAAGLLALERHVERLGEDHARARRLAVAMAALPGFTLDPARVATNIVVARVRPALPVPALLAGLESHGVRAGAWGPGQVRLVTHLDVDDAGIDRAVGALRAVSSARV
jgi:threonine aldolase